MVELLSERQQGLVPASALSSQVSRSTVSRAVQQGRIVRVRPRVYALAELPVVGRRVVEDSGPAPAWVAHVRAALLSLSASAASGRTAAALRGWELLVEPTRTVDLAVPHGRSRTAGPGVRVTQVRTLVCDQLHVLEGTAPLAVTDAVTTVVRCCLDLPLVEAVVVCDSALRARAVSLPELGRAALCLPGVRGAARVRRVIELASDDAGSVLESVMRVRLALAGITGVLTQVALRDASGRYVLRVDFCFRAQRLVVEVDGARWHPDEGRDRRTDNALAELGWRVLRFRWAEVVYEHPAVVEQVRRALSVEPAAASPGLGARQAA